MKKNITIKKINALRIKYGNKEAEEVVRQLNREQLKKTKVKHEAYRGLGYTVLMPLEEGEVGHHVTNEHVIGIPAEVHQHFCSAGGLKHRTHVLQWLKTHDKKKYKKVLCVLAQQPLNGL